MRKFLILLLFGFGISNTYSQNSAIRKIDSLITLADYNQAFIEVNIFSSTVSDPSQLTLLSNKKAELLTLQGKLIEAEKVIEEIKPSTTFLEGITLTNLGFIQLNKARFDLALEKLELALEKFRAANQLNTREGAKCLAHLALVYSSMGKYNQARDNELQALQIRQQLYGDQSEEVAASLNDLGLILLQSDGDKALEYYEKALAIYQKLHGNNHPKIAISNTNIGILYRQQELYGDAINNFESARAIWEKIYPNGHPNTALVNSYLGQTYQRMRNPSVAFQFYEKALELYRRAYGEKHPDISQTLNQIGLVKLESKKFDEAITNFHQAIIANSPRFNSPDYKASPAITDYYNAKVMLYSVHFKAQALEARHYGKTLRLEDLKLALQNLLVCDSIIDDIRHHSSDEGDKLALGESANEVYEDGVRIAEAISIMTIKSDHYRQFAFYFAEKSKSAVLLESIADVQAKSFAGIPDGLIEEEKTLKSTITLLSQKLALKPSPEEERTLREQLFTNNQKYIAFTRKLEHDYPNYYDLKFNQSTATIAQIQNSLEDGTTVLSYFISEKSKRLYLFKISKSNVTLLNLTLPDDFDRQVKGLTNGIYYSDFSTYKKSAITLSKLLLPSIKDDRVIIIPSGRLGTLPFEALVTNKKLSDFPDAAYALEKYKISYEFSSSLMLQKKQKSKDNINPSIFLCAPVQFNERDNLNDLPGTEQEVNTIAGLFGANSKSVKFKDASESLIKSKSIANYTFLHFATHGIVDETEPELSRIFLQASDREDGNLYAGEIYNMNLQANLAVLSACQTGLGKFSKGEGVIGLSRALVYAGAKNIIVSFWSVSDESTAQLMEEFYKILLKENSSDFGSALQKAKLKMITEKNYSAPYYWAPFVLIGN